MKLTDILSKEYESLFTSARITNQGAVKWAMDRVQRNWARYESVEEQTGVPACVIAVLHCLEASFDFGSHLHNGDPLTARTRQVPAGRPKTGSAPFTWEESALDALQYDGALTVKEWNIATTLHFLEGFNGWGYRTGAGRATTPPMRSPYLWSMTQHYNRGKYVADGKWDSNAVSAQVGACALLLAMEERGLPVFDESVSTPAPETPIDVPVSTQGIGRTYAPCPVPVPWAATLGKGHFEQGAPIYHLQCALIGLGYLAKPKEGELVGDVFNEHVEYAVKKLQADNLLTPDGIVGPKTRAAIEKALTRARAPKPGKPTRCEFHMDLEPSSALRAGSLRFFDASGNLVRREPCTSGLPGYQDHDDIWTRGAGPCPPVSGQAIRFSSGYHLKKRGIEGWFFPMLPDPIMRNGAVGRSEIGLHRDANVPGTAGCLGLLLSKAEYDEFVAWAKPLGDLPLMIVYT